MLYNALSYFITLYKSVALPEQIQLISVCCATIIGIISIIISLINISMINITYKRSLMGHFEAYAIWDEGKEYPYIIFRNSGNSPLRITDITIDNASINSSSNININPFKNFINCTLASNQEYRILYEEANAKSKPFSISCDYVTLNKSCNSTNMITFSFLSSTFIIKIVKPEEESKDKSKDPQKT